LSDFPISEQYRLVAKKWNDYDGAASLLEETKSAVLSERMLALGEMPVSRAEMIVKASPEWREHIEAMVAARKEANLLKCQMEYIKMRFSEQQSAEANARAERKL
jgi:hypothetical protein